MTYRKILFVCSGNQCRTPMVVAIFKDMVDKDLELSSAGIEVESAGTLDYIFGAPATDNAGRVMAERGLDVSLHTAKHINPDLVAWADVIVVMGDKHTRYILENFPNAAQKVHSLTEFAGQEGGVADPIGQGIEKYRECANLLESLIGAMIEGMK